MFDPSSKLLRAWEVIIMGIALFSVIWAPMSALINAYGLRTLDTFDTSTLDVILLATCPVCLFDVAMQMNTAAYGPFGSILKSRRQVLEGYGRSFFIVDVITSVPFYALFSLAGAEPAAWATVNLLALRAIRIQRVVFAIYLPVVFRLVNIVAIFSCVTHWVAVALVAAGLTHPEEGWIADAGMSVDADGLGAVYYTSLYMSFTLMTSVGFGDIHPVTLLERQIAIVLLIVGSVAYASVFGMVFEIVKKLLVRQIALEERLESAANFVHHYQIEGDLREKIFAYTYALAQGGRDVDVRTLGLPEHVETEILVHMNGNLIRNVPLFSTASFNFIRALVLQMEPVVVMKRDYIMVMGDLSDCMFFVSKVRGARRQPPSARCALMHPPLPAPLPPRAAAGTSRDRSQGRKVCRNVAVWVLRGRGASRPQPPAATTAVTLAPILCLRMTRLRC